MTEPRPTPPEHFATLLQLLQQAVAACHKDGLMTAATIVWLWNRLAKIGQRFARLAARIEAGTFRPRRYRGRKSPARTKPRQRSPVPQPFGWLMPLVPWVPMRRFWAGPANQSLQHLLNDPEMQALMAAAPAEMGRILRPLCWMLGIKPPPVLAPPRRPAPEPDAGAAPPAAPPPAPTRHPTRHPPPAPPPQATAESVKPGPAEPQPPQKSA